jgi:hypothetical protein
MNGWVVTIPGGLLFVAFGLFQWLRPRSWWNLTTAWRVADPTSGPSETFTFWTKVGGLAYIGLGVFFGLAPLFVR